MARMYNSRLLLDPSMIQYVANRADRNVQFNNELSNRNADSIRSLLENAGKTAGEYRQMNDRANEVSQWDIPNDPMARAAREEYIRTGNSNPLMSYQMQKMAAEQRAIDAQKAAENKASSEAFHNAVRLSQVRPEYAKIQKSMWDAIDAGDMEMANAYKKSLEAYETEFGADKFGQDSASAMNARMETKKNREKAAAREAQRQSQALDEAMEIESRMYKAKTFDEKQQILKDIDNVYKYNFMNDQERLELKKRLQGIQTYGEKQKEGYENTSVNISNKRQEKKAEEDAETKALADAAKKKIDSGHSDRVTRKERIAYDKVYGK